MPLYQGTKEVNYKWARYGGIESDASLDIATIAMEAEWSGERTTNTRILSENEINRMKNNIYSYSLQLTIPSKTKRKTKHLKKNQFVSVTFSLTFRWDEYYEYRLKNNLLPEENLPIVKFQDLIKLIGDSFYPVIRFKTYDEVINMNNTDNTFPFNSYSLIFEGDTNPNKFIGLALSRIAIIYNDRINTWTDAEEVFNDIELTSDLLQNTTHYVSGIININEICANVIGFFTPHIFNSYSDFSRSYNICKFDNTTYFNLIDIWYSMIEDRFSYYKLDSLSLRMEDSLKPMIEFDVLNNKLGTFTENISNNDLILHLETQGIKFIDNRFNKFNNQGKLITKVRDTPITNSLENSSSLPMIPYVLDKPNEVKLTDFGFTLPSDSYIVDWDDGPITTDWTEYLSRANHVYNPTTPYGYHLIEAKGHDFSYSYDKFGFNDEVFTKFFIAEKKFSKPGVSPEIIMRIFGHVFRKTKTETIDLFRYINLTKFNFKAYIRHLTDDSSIVNKYNNKIDTIPEDDNLRTKCHEIIRELRTEINKF